MEEIANKSKVEDLTIKLAMCMAATDSHLDQKELNVIKNWAKSLTLELEEDKAEEKRNIFQNLLKKHIKRLKVKKFLFQNLSLSLMTKLAKVRNIWL